MADQTGAVDLMRRQIEVAKATTMTSATPGAPPLPSFVLLDVRTADAILAALERAEEVAHQGCEFCENGVDDLGEERDGGREPHAHWWACGRCWNEAATETSTVIAHLSDLLDRALKRIPELEQRLSEAASSVGLLRVENVALREAAGAVVSAPRADQEAAIVALVAVLSGELGTRDLEVEEERDAMQRRAEAAESDWQAAEKRAQRVEAAAQRNGRWEHAHDCGILGPQLATRACTCGLDRFRIALAPAPEGSERPRDVAADMHSAWGIIANVNNGDWTLQSPEWQQAARAWRDLVFHAHYCDLSAPAQGEEGKG